MSAHPRTAIFHREFTIEKVWRKQVKEWRWEIHAPRWDLALESVTPLSIQHSEEAAIAFVEAWIEQHPSYREHELAVERERAYFAQCWSTLVGMGFDVTMPPYDGSVIIFEFRGGLVRFWPRTEWASGKTIHDGRGFQNLLEQVR